MMSMENIGIASMCSNSNNKATAFDRVVDDDNIKYCTSFASIVLSLYLSISL
jgi:hypothetical protein